MDLVFLLGCTQTIETEVIDSREEMSSLSLRSEDNNEPIVSGRDALLIDEYFDNIKTLAQVTGALDLSRMSSSEEIDTLSLNPIQTKLISLNMEEMDTERRLFFYDFPFEMRSQILDEVLKKDKEIMTANLNTIPDLRDTLCQEICT